MTIPKGRIKTYKEDRGYGFITPDQGGEDVFFHVDEVNDRGFAIEQGAPVEYDTKPGGKPGKLKAVRVRVLGFVPDEPPEPPRSAPPLQSASRGQKADLPEECCFRSFYNDDGCLQQSIPLEAAKSVATTFLEAGLKATQLRKLLMRYRAFALPLSNNTMSFPKALERFGSFYVEGVVRQQSRTDQRNNPILPTVVKEFIDQHKDVIQCSDREMVGFLKYLTYIMCYFGEPKSKRY